MTIRRDLEKMHNEGLIERCHGGAVSKVEVKYDTKVVKNKESKKEIAKKTMQFIEDGMSIYLDSGTTTLEIAKLVCEFKNITVVTNDLIIAKTLINSNTEVFICGGYLQKSTGSTLGYYATNMIKSFKFDIGFLGAAIVNEKFDVFTPTVDKAFLKRQVINQCRKAFLVVDSSKFNRQGMNKINNLSEFYYVVTDYVFNDIEKEKITELNIKLITV